MSEPARRGRRDNGLVAVAYVPLADVDPRIGDRLLDILWAARIPAYLEPPSDTDALRALTAPSQPVDRLWVDGDRHSDARKLVEAEAAELPTEQPEPSAPPDRVGSRQLAADEEAAWNALVAGFATDGASDVHPWPVAEDLEDTSGETETEAGTTTRAPKRPRTADPQSHNLLDALDALDGIGSEDELEGHFEPPPPPPIPKLSKYAVLALVLVVLGILLLFLPGLAGLSGSDGVFALGVISILGGVSLLIWRLKEDRSDDDGPDDGAIV